MDLAAAGSGAWVAAGAHILWLDPDEDWQPSAASAMLPGLISGIGSEGDEVWAALGSKGVVRLGPRQGPDLPVTAHHDILGQDSRDVAVSEGHLAIATEAGVILRDQHTTLDMAPITEGVTKVSFTRNVIMSESARSIRLFRAADGQLTETIRLEGNGGLLDLPWLFTTSDDGLRIWSVDAEARAVEVASLETWGPYRLQLRPNGHMAKSGNHLLVGGTPELYVIDTSNPDAPMVIDRVPNVSSPRLAASNSVLTIEGRDGDSGSDHILILTRLNSAWNVAAKVDNPLGHQICDPIATYLLCGRQVVDYSHPAMPQIVGETNARFNPEVLETTAFGVERIGEERLLTAVTVAEDGSIGASDSFVLPADASSLSIDPVRRTALVALDRGWIEVEIDDPAAMRETGNELSRALVDTLHLSFYDGIGYGLSSAGDLVRADVATNARLADIPLWGAGVGYVLLEDGNLYGTLQRDGTLHALSIDLETGIVRTVVPVPGCGFIRGRWAVHQQQTFMSLCDRLVVIDWRREDPSVRRFSHNLGVTVPGDRQLYVAGDQLFLLHSRWVERLLLSHGTLVVPLDRLE